MLVLCVCVCVCVCVFYRGGTLQLGEQRMLPPQQVRTLLMSILPYNNTCVCNQNVQNVKPHMVCCIISGLLMCMAHKYGAQLYAILQKW